MADNLIAYARTSLEIGAAGIFMSVPAAKAIVRRDVFLAFVKPYAQRVFAALSGPGRMNVAHIHGDELRVATLKDEEFSLVAYEAQSPRKDIMSMLPLLAESRKTRCLGATALDLSLLARGAISVFVNPSPSRTIDFGAGWLLVREAGGVFTDIKGNAIEQTLLGLNKSTSLLASGNKALHEKAIRLLQKPSVS